MGANHLFSSDLKQFQIDMIELDAMLVQIGRVQDRMSEISEYLEFKLQVLLGNRRQFMSTVSSTMEMQKDTQK